MSDSLPLYTAPVACAEQGMPYAVDTMIERMKQSKYRKVFGTLLVIYGVLALILPGIPGAWFIFIGLEFFGIRLLWGEKMRLWWNTRKTRSEVTSKEKHIDPSRPVDHTS